MIKEAITTLINGKNLTESEAETTMYEIMSGKCTDAQIGGILVALRMKGETIDEIAAFTRVMRKKATRINVHSERQNNRSKIDDEIILDTCGTGGTDLNTFNISTTTAFVAAGAGVKVAKHGNKAASSTCGSADVLGELGVNLNMEPDKVAECINEIGVGFLFAPLLHNAMKYVIRPRKELGIRTIFNVLGPLTNPAGATAQILGVYNGALTEKMANVLKKLGAKKAFVVHGEDSLDEITITGKTTISELFDGQIRTYEIEPADFGFERATLKEIRGGDAQINAEIMLSLLNGESGTRRNIVIMNAAYALIAANKADNIQSAMKLAEESIDSGKAMQKLEMLRKFSTG